MITRRIFTLALFATPVLGCEPVEPDDEPKADFILLCSRFEGRWVEVLLGGDGDSFELAQGGSASSIDAPATTYLSWREDGNTLYLTTAEDGEVGYIASLSDDGNLHLGDAGDMYRRVFRKLN